MSKTPTDYVDPALKVYEQGLKAFFGKKYDKAAEFFGRVQEEADQANLAARAQVFSTACARRTEDEPASDDPSTNPEDGFKRREVGDDEDEDAEEEEPVYEAPTTSAELD